MEIKVRNISKSFKNNTVLQDVNLDLVSGKIYGLIGPNGSGKTVLMKIIAGVMKPSSGTVTIDGQELHKDIQILPNVGVIFEKPEFFNDLSGFDNLMLLSQIQKQIDSQKIKETLQLVGLDSNNTNKVKSYSLGMVQRLGIAQAIMENQKILILDEPTNALDQEGVIAILKLLKQKKEEGCIILLTSHQLEVIYSVCDEIYTINHHHLEKAKALSERVITL